MQRLVEARRRRTGLTVAAPARSGTTAAARARIAAPVLVGFTGLALLLAARRRRSSAAPRRTAAPNLASRALAESADPQVRTTDQFVDVGPETDGTPVRLDTRLYLPAGDEPLPAVLLAHGFGGNKESVDEEARQYAADGHVVLTFTARGFGRSGGRIHLNSPDHEIKDGTVLLDLLAARPEVRQDGPGGPPGRGGGRVLRRRVRAHARRGGPAGRRHRRRDHLERPLELPLPPGRGGQHDPRPLQAAVGQPLLRRERRLARRWRQRRGAEPVGHPDADPVRSWPHDHTLRRTRRTRHPRRPARPRPTSSAAASSSVSAPSSRTPPRPGARAPSSPPPCAATALARRSRRSPLPPCSSRARPTRSSGSTRPTPTPPVSPPPAPATPCGGPTAATTAPPPTPASTRRPPAPGCAPTSPAAAPTRSRSPRSRTRCRSPGAATPRRSRPSTPTPGCGAAPSRCRCAPPASRPSSSPHPAASRAR